MVDIQTLYGHLKTLTKQWFYDKTETDAKLDLKLDAADVPTKTSDLTNDSNFISTSQTVGLIKNDGTIDTTQYISEHQSLANYVEKSATAGLIKNDGTIDTTQYLSEHQDISGKANISDLATVATSGSYADLENIPATFAPTAHEHSAADVKDSNAYEHIGTSANATQAAINYAIDNKIGALLSIDLIQVETTLPTASAATMNKLYLVPEAESKTHDSYEIYVTVEDEGTYAWEKVDTARIDLSGYATISHVHGNLTNDGKIGSNANYFVYTSTGGAVDAKEKIGNITTAGAIGTDSGKMVVTTTSGVLTTSDMVSEMDATVQALIQYGESL